jgi:hypothetical protein
MVILIYLFELIKGFEASIRHIINRYDSTDVNFTINEKDNGSTYRIRKSCNEVQGNQWWS